MRPYTSYAPVTCPRCGEDMCVGDDVMIEPGEAGRGTVHRPLCQEAAVQFVGVLPIDGDRLLMEHGRIVRGSEGYVQMSIRRLISSENAPAWQVRPSAGEAGS